MEYRLELLLSGGFDSEVAAKTDGEVLGHLGQQHLLLLQLKNAVSLAKKLVLADSEAALVVHAEQVALLSLLHFASEVVIHVWLHIILSLNVHVKCKYFVRRGNALFFSNKMNNSIIYVFVFCLNNSISDR
eukprot:CAMPEP_0168335740 /NCGR_PEP_ID=MMETSP0213-20121227/11102_1 /TAXON_ID=151035 /ORGANISM="Euplotes harpa, Strain FSP1.4" /LENGTH=130 /DNA_ID=CAMNT_0008340751 /DNA_START=57 /DNA_END=449 /DNA_ORIENTATION=-